MIVMEIITKLEDFKKTAQEYNLLPVFATMLGDRETPVSLYEKLVGEDIGFLLESAESTKSFGRYSFIGFNPLAKVTAYQEATTLQTEDGQVKKVSKAPMDALKEILQSYKAPQVKDLPPFCGGMIGYLAFEVVGTWEKMRGMQIDADDVLAQMMVCRDVVIMDHLKHTLYFITWSENVGKPEAIYEQACLRLRDSVRRLQKVVEPLGKGQVYASGKVEEPDFAKHQENIGKIKEYIVEGDTYQAVLSARFRQFIPSHPFCLYRQLRKDNPSAYMFYLNFGEKKLVGASPEMLVRVQKDQVTTYPIAGTRPRGRTTEEENALMTELLNDRKELAEHCMLVDLGRNDIGRVSKPGTVEVTRFKDIEFFSHVMHIVSEVNGVLRDDMDAFEAFKACFPAGTVSGAPKIRAMEIIAELEKEKRGVYAGAVGYWDFNGNMDTCIAIRTMSIENDVATVQGGGGIVADSDALAEVNEIRQKTKVLLNILEEKKRYADFD